MNESQLREQYVNVMRGWIGLKRSDRSHKPIIDAYNKISPLPRGVRMDYSAPWCAATVSAAASVADLLDIIPAECSCSAMIALLQKIGAWWENDAYVPSSGDLVFYDWQDAGVGDNRGAPDHVGIVESVSGGYITVIEGNMGSSYVGRRKIKVNGKYIRGFGLPDFKGKAAALTAAQKDSTTTAPIAVVAQRCADGHWGNGAERKARLAAAGYTQAEITEIQFLINLLSSDGWRVAVSLNTSDSWLNIRSGPGKERYSATGKLKDGDIIVITEVRTGDGSKSGWGKLKDNSGWVALDYVETA